MTNKIYLVAKILTIIGAINWGLVGLRDLNLVTYIFGDNITIIKIIYLLVGASGVYGLTSLFNKKLS